MLLHFLIVAYFGGLAAIELGSYSSMVYLSYIKGPTGTGRVA